MTIKAELRPHKGKQFVRELGTVVELDNKQWMVYAINTDAHPGTQGSSEKPFFVGFMEYAEGRPFLPHIAYVEQPPEIQSMIYDAVNIEVSKLQPGKPPRPLGILPLTPEAVAAADAALGPEDDEDDEEDDSDDE